MGWLGVRLGARLGVRLGARLGVRLGAWLGVFRSRRMAVLFVLGFSSGLPLYLTGNTLQIWLTQVGVDLGRIAAFSAIGLAYTFKFAWAPMFDWIQLPLLGRRRG